MGRWVLGVLALVPSLHSRPQIFFASDAPIDSFRLPDSIRSTGANQENDPNLVYNHFQEWELTNWTPIEAKSSRKSASPKDLIITLKKADLFDRQQNPIKRAYWDQVEGYVPAPVWKFAQST